jgi:ceramide glucosyltransferase
MVFTFGLPWALATLLAARGAQWAWGLLTMTVAARLAVGFVAAEEALHDRQVFRNILWLPLRDLIAPFVWAAGFLGNRIHWRGDLFDLKDGRLTAVRQASPADWRK